MKEEAATITAKLYLSLKFRKGEVDANLMLPITEDITTVFDKINAQLARHRSYKLQRVDVVAMLKRPMLVRTIKLEGK
jgi:hypothetical protein